ncbi:hypothetical protein MTR64_18690 [Novosphingobium sp. 2580]|uniref:Glycosyltransferase n=1 Tax=Novosphingobium album (ex Hu et al. 2023) TaxID=2930093 RepID=A0ABT0B6D6_9SPHN|nr:hypothetical protein [Novosphingobium album (ex Hu et al. 2023)]
MRTLLARAHSAADAGDWQGAVDAYSAILRRNPGRADLRIQLGHAFKEMHCIADAEDAYRRAAEDAPDDPDAPFHLGLLQMSRGAPDAALAALESALSRDPLHEGAFDALWNSRLLPDLPPSLLARIRQALRADVADREAALARQNRRKQAAERHGLSDYASFRPAMTIPAPTPPAGTGPVLIQVDGISAAPSFVRMTLESLLASTHSDWQVIVHVDDKGMEHPVASLATVDPRITFISAHDQGRAPLQSAAISAYLTAGTWLDPEALGWIIHTFSTTEAQAATCDWDWCSHAWDKDLSHAAPEVHGVFDMDRLAASPVPPPLIALRNASRDGPLACEDRRRILLSLGVGARIAHIPLPLAAIGSIAERAKIAPKNGEDMPIWSQPRDGAEPGSGNLADAPLCVTYRPGRPPLTQGAFATGRDPIRVIIPTRDCAVQLNLAIDTLVQSASQPELLSFTIIDNRSAEPQTQVLLGQLASRTGFAVLHCDTPFNWAALNDLAAGQSGEPILVLANNDIEMLSEGWDDRLRIQLQRQDVGIVGARLLYPDRSIQHAGMIFGFNEGAPIHDGVGTGLSNAATDPRFDHCHACSSVTGAFLAIRKDLYVQAGGLDPVRFIVAYNDVDLCLAVRALGRTVLYDPGIELIHHESLTRGVNDNRKKVAWDQEELRALYHKWGEAIRDEPGISPWWARDAVYQAFRPLEKAQIIDYIARSADRPWTPRPGITAAGAPLRPKHGLS